jgi:hypothetical protein
VGDTVRNVSTGEIGEIVYVCKTYPLKGYVAVMARAGEPDVWRIGDYQLVEETREES